MSPELPTGLSVQSPQITEN